MKPIIAIVGRANVGKSTLFNRLTRGRDAIVADVPGVTRDRHYGEGRLGERGFIAIDTGGLEPAEPGAIYAVMARQTEQAIAEADAVILVTDARQGLVPGDREIAARLRRLRTPVWIAANKAEGRERHAATAEFHELGLGAPAAVSAAHGEGVGELIEAVLDELPEPAQAPEPAAGKHPRVAIVGRPNVGKSTLVNALVGEERMIAHADPGTTRDAIEVPFERAGRRYTLIDTAGLRRRGKAGHAVERFSIVKTLQAIEAANVAVLVLDALEGVSEQDAHVAGYILERGRAVVLAVNKWDAADREQRARARAELGWKLPFLAYAETHFISAQAGKGLSALLRSVNAAYASATAKLATPRLTRALIAAVERQAPPRKGYQRPKPRYAHQGGSNPPRIVIHGNALEHLGAGYLRYLEGWFRKAFGLTGTPLRIELRTGANPYAGRGSGKK